MCECSYGIPVRKITFWIFGGVAAIEDDVQTPGAEFFIAVVGPLTSAALGALLVGISFALFQVPFHLSSILLHYMYMYLFSEILAFWVRLVGTRPVHC